MGLETTNPSSRVYLSISDGKIAQRYNEEVEGSVKCTNKDGTKTWWERRYPAVSGIVTNVYKRETDWGQRLVIDIQDGEVFSLEMNWSSRYSSGFFLSMPNIDFKQPVTFSPWMKVVGGSKKTNLYISQNNENVKWFWDKENPGDLPQMVQVTVKGQTVWDDTERQAYFERYINEHVTPKLSPPAYPETYDTATVIDDDEPNYKKPSPTAIDKTDDLPF